MTVVGIVADERHNGVTGIVKEKFYVPHSQWHVATGGNLIRGGFLVVRTTGDPMALAGAGASRSPRARSEPAGGEHPADDRSGRARRWRRRGSPDSCWATFAAIALTLAAVGIYGVLSYLVAQRTHEIGIRLAIGADRSQVLAMVLRQGLTLAGGGIVVGLVAAFALTRLMSGCCIRCAPAIR